MNKRVECKKCGAINSESNQRCWDCGANPVYYPRSGEEAGRWNGHPHSSDPFKGTGSLKK